MAQVQELSRQAASLSNTESTCLTGSVATLDGWPPKRVEQRKRITDLGKAKRARNKTSPEAENGPRRKNHQTGADQKPALN